MVAKYKGFTVLVGNIIGYGDPDRYINLITLFCLPHRMRSNPLVTCWVMLQTDKQKERQTKQENIIKYTIFYLECNALSNLPFTSYIWLHLCYQS